MGQNLHDRTEQLTVTDRLIFGQNAEQYRETRTGRLEPISGATLVDAGAGFTGTGTIHKTSIDGSGEVVVTRFLIDLTGLNSSAAADIIGGDGLSSCHFGQVDHGSMGTVYAGVMTCLEAPTGGEPDIDIYSATESTGAEDSAITDLTETAILDAAADWTISTQKAFGTIADGQYLYLVGSGTGTDATYTAGIFMIELYGYI